MIEVSINNSKHQLEADCSIENALEQLGYQNQSMLGIALNQTFVPREQWSETRLKAHDQLDILSPISGG